MTEPILAWWERRRFSRGVDVPYPIGRYREAWASYPALIRQYHPDLNSGITLSQIPPAADVLLCWQCEAGHVFVATPAEQRGRPRRERRRSAWCPDCTAEARPVTPVAREPVVDAPAASGATTRATPRRPTPRREVCSRTPPLPPGTPFASACAPAPSSAAEARLRALLAATLPLDPTPTAVRLSRPFFDHLEAWPDLVLGELRVAVEYDTTGRHGLEHVGPREAADRRKDRALRSVGWEVVRIRTGRLPAIGPFDVVAASAGAATVSAVIDRLREIRGALLVDAYLA